MRKPKPPAQAAADAAARPRYTPVERKGGVTVLPAPAPAEPKEESENAVRA